MRQKPTVLSREIVANSRSFRVESVELRFSNGVERTYERLVGRGNGYGAVMIVAMLDAEHAVLVEEYCGGTDDYQLSLPKGLIEPGEDVLVAANRELKEEAGFGARRLTGTARRHHEGRVDRAAFTPVDKRLDQLRRCSGAVGEHDHVSGHRAAPLRRDA